MKKLKRLKRLPVIKRGDSEERAQGGKKTLTTKSLNLQVLFWLFFFGSIVGFVLEGLWAIVRVGVWENHAATVWGPFCIVYGVGTVAMFVIAALISHLSRIVQFLVYAVAGSGVEFFASLLQEKLFGSVSWDYTDHAFNLFGRASLQMALIWGGLGVLFAAFVFPCFDRMLHRMQGRGWMILCILLAVFMVANLVVTTIAILRWRERLKEQPASNSVDRFMDRTYGNEKMAAIFSNMTFLE